MILSKCFKLKKIFFSVYHPYWALPCRGNDAENREKNKKKSPKTPTDIQEIEFINSFPRQRWRWRRCLNHKQATICCQQIVYPAPWCVAPVTITIGRKINPAQSTVIPIRAAKKKIQHKTCVKSIRIFQSIESISHTENARRVNPFQNGQSIEL
jgi:hypothetical protein